MTLSKGTVPPSASIADPQILGALHDRTSKGQNTAKIAGRDLARYYRLLAEQLATIELSQAEAMLVWHGLIAARSERFPSLVAAVASEAKRLFGFSDMREVNAERLLAHLSALTPLQTMALIDALERFDARNERNGRAEFQIVLRAVGIRLR